MSERLPSRRQAVLGLAVAAGFAAHFLGLVDWPWWVDWPVATWFYTVWGFFALVHARGVLEAAGAEGSWWVTWLAPLLVLFIPADALFNGVYGSIIFREWPRWFAAEREFLFSSRVKRHFRNADGASTSRQRAAAFIWGERLRAVDPVGHDFSR